MHLSKTSMADIRCSQPENTLTPQDGLLDNDSTSSLTADVNATLSSLPILRVRPLVPSRDGRRLAIRYSLQSLAAQIGLNHRSIFRLERELESQHLILASLLSEEDAKSLASLKDRAICHSNG